MMMIWAIFMNANMYMNHVIIITLANSKAVIPMDQISALLSYPLFCSNTSGAM